MQQFIHKNYNLNIIVQKRFIRFKRKKTIRIEYGQAKTIDLIKFSGLNGPEDIIIRLVKFIESHSTNTKKSDYNIIVAQFESIYNTLQETFRKRPEIIIIPDPEDDGSNKDAPYSSHIAFIAKELGETPHNLIYNYTLEELDYLTEGVVRNLNSQSDKGKQRNKLKALQTSAKNIFSEKKKMIEDFLKD